MHHTFVIKKCATERKRMRSAEKLLKTRSATAASCERGPLTSKRLDRRLCGFINRELNQLYWQISLCVVEQNGATCNLRRLPRKLRRGQKDTQVLDMFSLFLFPLPPGKRTKKCLGITNINSHLILRVWRGTLQSPARHAVERPTSESMVWIPFKPISTSFLVLAHRHHLRTSKNRLKWARNSQIMKEICDRLDEAAEKDPVWCTLCQSIANAECKKEKHEVHDLDSQVGQELSQAHLNLHLSVCKAQWNAALTKRKEVRQLWVA